MVGLIHGKGKMDLIFQKFWKKYELNYSEILEKARIVVSDITFFSEFIKRTQKSDYGYVIRLNWIYGFFRNLPEAYGYMQDDLMKEDTVFRMIATQKLILQLIYHENFDGMNEFNLFTKGWFNFDFFEHYSLFIQTNHGCQLFEKKLETWKKENGL